MSGGKNSELLTNAGSCPREQKRSRIDPAVHVALRQRQPQKAQISANTPLQKPPKTRVLIKVLSVPLTGGSVPLTGPSCLIVGRGLGALIVRVPGCL